MDRTALSLVLLAAPLLAQDQPAPEAPAAPEQALPADAQGLEPGLYARLETSKGVMILRLDHERAPMTVANFVGLAEGTKEWTDPKTREKVRRPFYDGLTFHRIIRGFMIQGGCPLGNGMGGPGYEFANETHPALKHDKLGVLAMANAGPDTNGSQFYITLDAKPHLDGGYSIFGQLVRGEEVLREIGNVATDADDRPQQPVTIVKATILRLGEEAQTWRWPPTERPVPACEAEVDPQRVPGPDQPEQAAVQVKLICVQYAGAYKGAAHITRTKQEALERARLILPHVRAKGADIEALARRWSDMPGIVYPLKKGSTDPSFAPVFRLKKGQVSDPVETPFGVMIFEAQ